jgi:cytochrome c556
MTIENPRRLRAARIARLAQIALVLLAGLAGATLWAHGEEPATPGEQNLRYRHAVYTAIGWNAGHLRAMLEGKEPYDAARVAAAAEHLAALAPLLGEAFPADSNLPPKSEAKAEVWTHWDDFSHRLEDFRGASASFAMLAAQGDPQAIRPAFSELTRHCKGCHDQYRRAH